MTVRVDWQTGAAAGSDLSREFPGIGDWPKYLVWRGKVTAQERTLSKVVPVLEYTGQELCGITVHLLLCDELQATTSCLAYGSPEYPIKTPLHLPETSSCPK